MPKKFFNQKIKVPCDLIFKGETYRTMLDEDFLTFVDFKTGLYNRIITRDPISGLGMLPPIAIEKIQLKLCEARSRDAYNPLVPTSNAGPCREEYNCLYTKKAFSKRPRLPQLISHRDPISGLGITDIEYISESPSKSFRKSLKRDPITHSVPIENMNEKPQRTLVKSNVTHVKRDPITHSVPMANMGEKSFRPALGSHDKRPNSSNIISHDNNRTTQKPFVGGTRHFHIKRQNSDSPSSTYQTSCSSSDHRPKKNYHQHCIPPNNGHSNTFTVDEGRNSHVTERRHRNNKEAIPVPDIVYDNAEFTKVLIRNPITHEEKYIIQPTITRSRSMSTSRWRPSTEDRNPITHVNNTDPDYFTLAKRKYPRERETNPIVHSNSLTNHQPSLPPRGGNQRQSQALKLPIKSDVNYNERPLTRSKTVTRVSSRNPITGEGFTPDDYLPCMPAKAFMRSSDIPLKGKTMARSPTPNPQPTGTSSSTSTQRTKPIFSAQVKHSINTVQY